jgi:hypothetical protein
MARRTILLDEKIEKAEASVVAAKKKYDAALDVPLNYNKQIYLSNKRNL